jgi:hypothetical protein
MRTTKQLARHYSEAYTGPAASAIETAFHAGVEFALLWISVDDELPPDKEDVLVKVACTHRQTNNETNIRILYPTFEIFAIDSYIREVHSWELLGDTINKKYPEYELTITHWRHIEQNTET